MTIGRLLKEATSRELAGWMVYLDIEAEIEKKRLEDERIKKEKQNAAMLKAHLTKLGEQKRGKRQMES